MRISYWSSDVCSSDLQPVLQDLFGPQRIAAVDQRHVMAVIGEVDRFLDSGVAAADHRHLLPPEKETVAGRAGGNARSAQLLLALQQIGRASCRERVGQYV